MRQQAYRPSEVKIQGIMEYTPATRLWLEYSFWKSLIFAGLWDLIPFIYQKLNRKKDRATNHQLI